MLKLRPTNFKKFCFGTSFRYDLTFSLKSSFSLAGAKYITVGVCEMRQEFLWKPEELVKLSEGMGRIREEFLQGQARLVKNSFRSPKIWTNFLREWEDLVKEFL